MQGREEVRLNKPRSDEEKSEDQGIDRRAPTSPTDREPLMNEDGEEDPYPP